MVYHRWFINHNASCPTDKQGKSFERLKQELSLSIEQERRLLQYRRVFHGNVDSISSKMKEERRLLIAELKQQDPDFSRLEEIIERINRLQLEAQKKVAEHLLEVKKMLEPEQ